MVYTRYTSLINLKICYTPIMPISVYKPLGLSPLQTINLFKKKYSDFQNHKISYAGRLDPMAEGLLLLLIDDENKARNEYLDLPKSYTFKLVLGIESDSNDILGIPQIKSTKLLQMQSIKASLEKITPLFTGTILQTYPSYSSKTIQGKPLYWWARENKLESITIPSVYRTIYQLTFFDHMFWSSKQMETYIFERIPKIQGDFRQERILESWKTYFKKNIHDHYVISAKAQVSSGTYIRGLVDAIGKKLKLGALSLEIVRTSIGDWSSDKALQIS